MPDQPNEALAEKILESMTDQDWQAFSEIGEELAKEEAKAQETQENSDDSTEEKESQDTSQTEETSPDKSEPWKSFQSEAEFNKWLESPEGSPWLKSRLQREKDKRERAEAKARRDAEEAAAEQNQEYQTLAEKRAERIKELEADLERLSPYEEQVSTYRETVESFANARMESLNLPRGVKALVERMEPKERLDWITENEADFSGTTETIPPAPNGDDSGSTPEADEAAKREAAVHTMRTF